MRMDRLGNAVLTDMLDRLGSKEPVPGGGAAAGVAGALSAALGSMVVAYSLGRKSLAQHQDDLTEIDQRLKALRTGLLEAADRDAQAYAGLNELWGLPKDDPIRSAKWKGALELAIAVPTEIMDAGDELLKIFAELTPICNQNLTSDLAGAAAIAEACVKSAGQNVRVNANMLDDADVKQSILDDLASRRESAEHLCASIERACGS
jgi:formiminotetrahydrofolate cyclodeaminase